MKYKANASNIYARIIYKIMYLKGAVGIDHKI